MKNKINYNAIENWDKICPEPKFINKMVYIIRNPYWNKSRPETKFQIVVNAYLETIYPEIFFAHVENEGKRNSWQQFYSVHTGLKSGMPDIMIFIPKIINTTDGVHCVYIKKIIYCGLAIELKIHPNKCTENQLSIQKQLSKAGWLCNVCYNFDEAKKNIDEYLK